MTEYGYMVNGQLIRQKTQTAQSKPLVYTEEPVVDERHATVYAWEEQQGSIVQVWDTIEIEPEEPPEELDDAEALSILLGGESE